MKIAIDIRDADGQRTGKGFFSFGLVSNILAQDRENQYVLYSDKIHNPFAEIMEGRENIEFISLPQTGLKWHLAALKSLKSIRPDMYFAPTSFIIPAFAPKWLKTVIVVHDLVAFLFPRNHSQKAVFIERLTLQRALHRAAKVFVVSENTQNDLIRLFRYPLSRTVEVPPALNDLYRTEIDEKAAEKVRTKFSLPAKFILAVGTLEPRKNFANLIKSFVMIKRKYPDYKLVIVGKKGWKHHEIDRAIRLYQLKSDVIFPGYMKDEELHLTYSMAEVFVFPSLYEGFGIPPLEAMASGCPVVASNVASIPEVVGDAGLLIDPKNAVKISDAIVSLIEDTQVRNMLLERGIQRVKQFSWANSASIAIEAFNSLK